MEQVSQNDVAFVNKFISWKQCINSIWTPTRNFYQKYLKKNEACLITFTKHFMKRKKGHIALMCPFQVKIEYKWNGVSWEGNTLCMYI